MNITVLFLVVEECGDRISCVWGENSNVDNSSEEGRDGDKCRESGRVVVGW